MSSDSSVVVIFMADAFLSLASDVANSNSFVSVFEFLGSTGSYMIMNKGVQIKQKYINIKKNLNDG